MSQRPVTVEEYRAMTKPKRASKRLNRTPPVTENRCDLYQVSTKPITVRLPFPPMLNHYYRTAVVGRHAQTYISKDGKAYRETVIAAWREVGVTFEGLLAMRIEAVYPNRLRRDIDGILKALLDSLEYAGAYRNDNQIKLLIAEQNHIEEPGWVEVTIGPKPGDRQKTLFETSW